MCPITDSVPAIGSLGAASLQGLREEATPFGKRLVGAGCDFADRQAAGVPGHHVATVGDIDLSVVTGALNSSTLMDGVQLGME